MCQFVSWIESEEEVFYLTKDDLKGKKFHEYKKYNWLWPLDIMGHGAIGFFYPEIRGVHRECSDFSNPENFPKQIVEDIKSGKFAGIGVCEDILNPLGLTKYKKITQPARADYDKIVQPAWVAYKKITQPARADYGKREQAARVDYEKIAQPARVDYEKITQAVFWKIAGQKKYRKNIWK